MRFCGIDLHSNNSFVVVIDESDRILAKRRCRNELGQILQSSSRTVPSWLALWSSRPTTDTGWSTGCKRPG